MFLLLAASLHLGHAWTRLTVVESGSCERAGCEVEASCPESTWPVACESAPRNGYAWLKDGKCVASSLLDEEIRVKLACTSMFESFIVRGDGGDVRGSRCPFGSMLQRCFCEACYGRPALESNGSCLAEVGSQSQSLCLRGDTQFLLQNAGDISFVEYCGWVPYQRPQNLPATSYRNDTDCQHVMLNARGIAGCSNEECTSLEDCIARCDLCSNCSAVLQMAPGSDVVRCYLQQDISVTETRSESFETGFFVNERNQGCQGEKTPERGIDGLKFFADLECQNELTPEKLYLMDAVGLTPLTSTNPWTPSCSKRRCRPGDLSILATFSSPVVVRCVTVQAPEAYGRGWILSKTSATTATADTGIQSLMAMPWHEVARSGKGMGVRATWDGLMEVEGDLRSSLSSWNTTIPGESGAVVPVILSLLLFFMCLSLILWWRYVHASRRFIQIPTIAAVVVPPPLEDKNLSSLRGGGLQSSSLCLDEINLDEANETCMSYLLPSEVGHVQNLLDFTYRSLVTSERRCPKQCGQPAPCPCVSPGGSPGLPVAFRVLNALKLTGKTTPSAYVKICREVQKKRDALKCLEVSSSLALTKYPELQEVLLKVEPSCNEVYLWYGTSVRNALNLQQGSFRNMSSLRFAESCTKADELAMDEAGHYEKVFALLLCRVCLGRFYFSTDMDKGEEEVRKGDFDSLLLDRCGDGFRECVVYNPKQVVPEFLVLYQRCFEGQENFAFDPAIFLEMPIYWTHVATSLTEGSFRTQRSLVSLRQRALQSLVDASSGSRRLIAAARHIEDSRLWLRYLRARDRKGTSHRIQGALEDAALDLHSELLLWYVCEDAEDALTASEGSFQTSPRQRRAGCGILGFVGVTANWIPRKNSRRIHLTEALPGGNPLHLLLCRVTLRDVQYDDGPPDLSAVQLARSAGKDALIAHANRGRKDVVLFHEDQLYPEFILELQESE